MSHSLRSKSFAVCSLVFASAGLIAVACGSDKSMNRDNPALTPGAGNDNPSNSAGTTGNATEPGAVNPNDGTPANPTPGNPPANNEGQTGELPIAPGDTPGETPGETGNNPPVTVPPATIAANCSAPEGAVPNLGLELVAGGLTRPLYVTQAPGDDTRLFIVLKDGTVRVMLNGELQETPFINVANVLTDDGAREQGLLGMAFHPDYATNGLFYLHFSSNAAQGLPPAGDTVVAEFKVSADRSVADPASRRAILTTAGLEANHNGGQLAFGPDKMLYFGLGDGGGRDDQHGNPGNGQSLTTLNAKILHLDPLGRDVNDAYSIDRQLGAGDGARAGAAGDLGLRVAQPLAL